MKKTYLLLCMLCIGLVAFAQNPVMGAAQMDKLLPLLEGKRVALLINHTSTIGETHLLDTLLAQGVDVKHVFAPEHGFRGKADPGETVSSGKDPETGIMIVSLYGNNRKPTPDQLKNIDVVVFDIQDVGARFYTYISTMHYVMEACAENGKEFIVCDRPNPCDYIDGAIRDDKHISFVSMDAIPVLHGCTTGELAQMINGEHWLKGGIQVKLSVIPMKGWKHGQPYSLPHKPSPNLPNDLAIALYPALCPFEGTTVSVGRGTLEPFQIIGSPYIKEYTYKFKPVSLEGYDKNPMHKDVWCYGHDLRTVPAPKGFTLHYVIQCYNAYKQAGVADKFFDRPNWFDLLMGTDTVRKQIIAGATEDEIRQGWQADLAKYRQMRQKYVLYEEQ